MLHTLRRVRSRAGSCDKLEGATVDSLRQRLVELSRLEEERWAEIVYERRLAEDAEKHADAFCQDAAMLQVRLQGLEKAESLLRQVFWSKPHLNDVFRDAHSEGAWSCMLGDSPAARVHVEANLQSDQPSALHGEPRAMHSLATIACPTGTESTGCGWAHANAKEASIQSDAASWSDGRLKFCGSQEVGQLRILQN